MKLDDFITYFLNNEYPEGAFTSDGQINPNYNSFKKTGLIAEIFEDHWDNYYTLHKSDVDNFRRNAPFEVKKIIDCHNKSLGCSAYECPNCKELLFISHTCKSRLCSSCGYKYKMERVENIMQTAYDVPHRQLVFTIPEELRTYFYFKFEERIDILFEAVKQTIYSILNITYKKNKNGKTVTYESKVKKLPGFFSFLHTFGRDLKWNPHIHVLLAEKIIAGSELKNLTYLDYDALSKRFMKILLDLLEKNIGKTFWKEKHKSYQNHKNGFYVYAEKKKFTSLKNGIEYVARYCGRAAISENRILNYDGTNVTFCYNDHVDESYHEVTVTAEEFIAMILRHLIPYNYKIIRYYGFYRKKHTTCDKMMTLITEAARKVRRLQLKFKNSVMTHFNRDPFNCPKCNTRCEYLCDIT